MVMIVVRPLPGAGYAVRFAAWLRGLYSARLLRRLAGIDTVVMQGHVFSLRARPLVVCRDLVPALVRCSRRFATWEIDEALYDDLISVLSLGLDVDAGVIEGMSIPPWELAGVISEIARVNGLPIVEAGRADLGEVVKALVSTGTNLSPTSPAPADGRGNTSIIA